MCNETRVRYILMKTNKFTGNDALLTGYLYLWISNILDHILRKYGNWPNYLQYTVQTMHNNFFPLFKYKFNKIEKEREAQNYNKSTKNTDNALEYVKGDIGCPLLLPSIFASLLRCKRLASTSQETLVEKLICHYSACKAKRYSPMSPRWRIHAIWHYIPAKRS